MSQASAPDPLRRRADLKVAALSGGFALTMLGAAFAAVPLYDWFCRVTGFGGTTMVATRAPESLGQRRIEVRFDANVAGNLGWRFLPETASVTLTPGETRTVFYRLRNDAPVQTVGIASYNVTPEIAGAYFNKIQCFCFTDQALKAGESREEAVVFFIDPAIEKDPNTRHINTITLSYTFFPSKAAPKVSEAPAGDGRRM
jgi:cytochrome c oxidase assembly protein subunit 11